MLTKFETYFEPKKLLKGYITEFQMKKQGKNESVQQYITELRNLAEKCEFGDSMDSQLCVAISNGVRDEKLKAKLWTEDLSLNKIIEKCQLWQQREQTKHLYSETPATSQSADVHALRGQRGRNYRGRQQGRGRGQQTQSFSDTSRGGHSAPRRGQRGSYRGAESGTNYIKNCGRCGSDHVPYRCPANGKTCAICKRLHHFAKVCRNKNTVNFAESDTRDHGYYVNQSDSNDRNNHVYEMFTHDKSEDNFVWLNETNNNHDNVTKWSVTVQTAGGDQVSFKIDTGADVNVLSKACYNNMYVKPLLQPSQTNILGFGKQPVISYGSIELKCVYKQVKYNLVCEVVEAKVPNVLSLKDSVRMNLVRRVDTLKTMSTNVPECKHQSAIKIIEEYHDVFQGVGKVPGKIKLKVNPDATPIAQPPRPLPVALRVPVQKKLKELAWLVEMDIIEKIPLGVPTPWCSALHVVPKKNGAVRLTMDPKDLNDALMREYHPTTTVEDIMQRCGNAKYFTVLDANQGYFQLELDETSREYTAFNTPFGRY